MPLFLALQHRNKVRQCPSLPRTCTPVARPTLDALEFEPTACVAVGSRRRLKAVSKTVDSHQKPMHKAVKGHRKAVKRR